MISIVDSIPLFPAETSRFSSSPNSHRFEPPIRQFSNRSDLLYVPTLGTFLSYERSLLRSFGSPQLRCSCPKKNVKIFQPKRQTFPAETSRFSSGNVKIFQPFHGKCRDELTVFLRWRRLGWSRQLPTISTTSGRGGRPLVTAGSLRNREVIFGFNGACGCGTGPTCDEEAASSWVSSLAAAEGRLAEA